MTDGNGLFPIDPTTLIGMVRLDLGDDTPDASGDFTFSDDAIDAALARGGDSIPRACGMLVKRLALQATLAGQSIKADDFSINTSNRGKDLLAVAKSYFDEADAADVIEGAGEMLVVNTRLNRPRRAEDEIGDRGFGYRLPWALSGLLREDC
jgi:hypothetical protein